MTPSLCKRADATGAVAAKPKRPGVRERRRVKSPFPAAVRSRSPEKEFREWGGRRMVLDAATARADLTKAIVSEHEVPKDETNGASTGTKRS